MTADAPTRFRLRRAYGVRMIGAGCVLLAIAVACWVIRSALAHALVTGIAVVVTVLGVLVLGLGVTLTLVRPTLLLLQASGLRNRTARSVGVRALTWTDVTDIAWSSQPFGHTLVVGLTNGTSSRIHTGVLNASEAEVENAIRTHADAAHGYRPL